MSQHKRPPKVYKVTDPEPSQRFDDIHPNLPSMPSLLLIIGSVRSAKSNLICNLLIFVVSLHWLKGLDQYDQAEPIVGMNFV